MSEEKKLKWIGTRPIRHDGVDKVTGKAGFGADLNWPGTLCGKILRSPHAHARIVRIDTSKAEAIDGVAVVLTGKDFPDPPTGKGAGEGPRISGIWRATSWRETRSSTTDTRWRPWPVGALAPAWGAPQAPLLLDPDVRDLLHEELSGERAKDHVIAISREHRIQGSRGYRRSAEYVLSELRRFGFDESEAWVESYPSDGRVRYQTWQSPSGWDIESAELRMVEPYDERIAGYPEVAMSLVTYSNPGAATAELVWVGRGTADADYEGRDVAGKLVLATGYGGSVHRLAVLRHGALGVVCYLDDERALEYPDMLAYTGMWPRTDELERTTFGFNLTHRQGSKLRALLEAGERVVLDAKVEGIGLEPYFMDVVVATIPGTTLPDEELVFTAHLDHPKESANDNASGSAAILDIARGLSALIDAKRLPAPRRTLRFLWVPEWYGTMAYIDAHPELKGPALGGKVLANLNLDMVGENLELLHSKLILTRTPHSTPSVVNEVVASMARMVDGMNVRTPRGSLSLFNWRHVPYSGGSDHMMLIERKVPGVMFSHSPDYTHHTSEDTPDKVDPVQLERCEILAASVMWYLANLAPHEATELALYAAAEAERRMHLEAMSWRRRLEAASEQQFGPLWGDAHSALDHSLHREVETVQSVAHFSRDEDVLALVDDLTDRIVRAANEAEATLATVVRARGLRPHPAPPPDRTIDPRVPERTTRGPLDFGLPELRLDAERAAWYGGGGAALTGNVRFELVNFVDGLRAVSQIRDAVAAEYGAIPTEVVGRYFDDLVSIGAMRWKEN